MNDLFMQMPKPKPMHEKENVRTNKMKTQQEKQAMNNTWQKYENTSAMQLLNHMEGKGFRRSWPCCQERKPALIAQSMRIPKDHAKRNMLQIAIN